MQRSKKGKAVYTQVGVWREKDCSIHLTLKGVKNGHVAVNAAPSKRNGHPLCLLDWINCSGMCPRRQTKSKWCLSVRTEKRARGRSSSSKIHIRMPPPASLLKSTGLLKSPVLGCEPPACKTLGTLGTW